MKEALTGAPFAPQQSVQRCCVRGKMVPLVQQQDVNRRRARFMDDKVYDHHTKQQKSIHWRVARSTTRCGQCGPSLRK